MNRVELSLNKKFLESNKRSFEKNFLDEAPNEEADMINYKIPPASLEIGEINCDDQSLEIYGCLELNGEYMGYLTVKLTLNRDTQMQFLESVIKKYNKIKTIMEATK